MWMKIKESKRAIALFLSEAILSVLFLACLVANKIVPGTVEPGVQLALANGIVMLFTTGVPALMVGISYTDGVEARTSRDPT